MMNKNTLYETLEVSENASPEIIEKAYKTLAKRYHPDLQSDAGKRKAEQMMKKINEAYDILGNKEKRQAYDRELKELREQIKQEELEKQREQIFNEYNMNEVKNKDNYYNNQQYNNEYTYKENNNIPNDNFVNNTENYNGTQNYDNPYEDIKQDTERRTEELKRRTVEQEEINRQYQNAYEDYLRSLGYRIKHKWTKEDYKNFFIAIGIIVVVALILWAIPPIRNSLIKFYEENPIIKSLVDVIVATITGIFRGIWNFITGLFN